MSNAPSIYEATRNVYIIILHFLKICFHMHVPKYRSMFNEHQALFPSPYIYVRIEWE